MDPPSVFDHPEPPTFPSSSQPVPHSIDSSTQNSLDLSTTDQTHHPSKSSTSGSPSNPVGSLAHNAQDSSTPTQPITLDQELIDLKKTFSGVGASLGGWWGKVQKQSADVLAASNITTQINEARKDLASFNLIEKAKREVERLGDHAKEGYSAISSEIQKGPDPNSNEDIIVNVDGTEITPSPRAFSSSSVATTTTATENEATGSSKGKERATNESPSPLPNSSSVFDANRLSSFFNKITKDSESLTASLQSKIPHLSSSGSFDLADIQKRAEGYLAKGEVYLQDVSKELKEFVQDAVKVIPPSEENESPNIPDQNENIHPSFRHSLTEKRRMLDLKRESMISQLRRDKSQLLLDPRNEDVNVQTVFDEFTLALQQAGGLDGEAWKKRIDAELELEEPDRSALNELFKNLVPASMSFETFWTRYFFRVYQIDQEEVARRLVLSAAQDDTEGEFSWDIEDESEPSSPAVFVKSHKSVGTSEFIDKEDQVETPRPSDLPSSMIGSAPVDNGNRVQSPEHSTGEDEWGNSPVETFFPTDAKTATTKENNASNNQAKVAQVDRRNSSSEPDTSDGFDVVSAQQSSDDKPSKSNNNHLNNRAHKDNRDADDDSDWE